MIKKKKWRQIAKTRIDRKKTKNQGALTKK